MWLLSSSRGAVLVAVEARLARLDLGVYRGVRPYATLLRKRDLGPSEHLQRLWKTLGVEDHRPPFRLAKATL